MYSIDFPEKDKIFSDLSVLLPQEVKIVVGLSGGPDSSFLFWLLVDFYREKWWNQANIVPAHYHHGQRKESDKEIKTIFRLYKEYDIYYNTDRPKKKSSETELRTARSAFFTEVATKEKTPYLALWHNLDDRIETGLINLLRGTSLQGFSNMTRYHYRKWTFFLRPLISLKKSAIQALCDTHHIPYFTDKSNEDSDYTIRNKLRNQIIPAFQSLLPQGKQKRYESFTRMYDQIERKILDHNSDHVWLIYHTPSPHRGAKKYYHIRLISPNKNNFYTSDDRRYTFQQLHISSQTSQKTLAERTKFSNTSDDGYKYIAGIYFFKAHGKLYAIDGEKEFWKKEYVEKKIIGRGKSTLFYGHRISLDPSRQWGVIRYLKAGDTYKWKKLRKRMINQKIPLFRRTSVPVIEKKGKIIAVVTDVIK